MAWNDLSMKEKHSFIRSAVSQGITDRNLIIEYYNTFDEGGVKEEPIYYNPSLPKIVVYPTVEELRNNALRRALLAEVPLMDFSNAINLSLHERKVLNARVANGLTAKDMRFWVSYPYNCINTATSWFNPNRTVSSNNYFKEHPEELNFRKIPAEYALPGDLVQWVDRNSGNAHHAGIVLEVGNNGMRARSSNGEDVIHSSELYDNFRGTDLDRFDYYRYYPEKAGMYVVLPENHKEVTVDEYEQYLNRRNTRALGGPLNRFDGTSESNYMANNLEPLKYTNVYGDTYTLDELYALRAKALTQGPMNVYITPYSLLNEDQRNAAQNASFFSSKDYKPSIINENSSIWLDEQGNIAELRDLYRRGYKLYDTNGNLKESKQGFWDYFGDPQVETHTETVSNYDKVSPYLIHNLSLTGKDGNKYTLAGSLNANDEMYKNMINFLSKKYDDPSETFLNWLLFDTLTLGKTGLLREFGEKGIPWLLENASFKGLGKGVGKLATRFGAPEAVAEELTNLGMATDLSLGTYLGYEGAQKAGNAIFNSDKPVGERIAEGVEGTAMAAMGMFPFVTEGPEMWNNAKRGYLWAANNIKNGLDFTRGAWLDAKTWSLDMTSMNRAFNPSLFNILDKKNIETGISMFKDNSRSTGTLYNLAVKVKKDPNSSNFLRSLAEGIIKNSRLGFIQDLELAYNKYSRKLLQNTPKRLIYNFFENKTRHPDPDYSKMSAKDFIKFIRKNKGEIEENLVLFEDGKIMIVPTPGSASIEQGKKILNIPRYGSSEVFTTTLHTTPKRDGKISLLGSRSKGTLKITNEGGSNKEASYFEEDPKDIIRLNIEYLQSEIPGFLPFGSSRLVMDTGFARDFKDFDGYITEDALAKLNSENFMHGRYGDETITYNIAKHSGLDYSGTGNMNYYDKGNNEWNGIDLNVLYHAPNGGTKPTKRALQLWQQYYPQEYKLFHINHFNEESWAGAVGKNNFVEKTGDLNDLILPEEIPHSPEELLANIGAHSSVIDMILINFGKIFGGTYRELNEAKLKHLPRIWEFIADSADSEAMLKTLRAALGTEMLLLAPKFPYTNVEENLLILEKMGIPKNVLKVFAEDPNKMLAVSELWFADNNIKFRGGRYHWDSEKKAAGRTEPFGLEDLAMTMRKNYGGGSGSGIGMDALENRDSGFGPYKTLIQIPLDESKMTTPLEMIQYTLFKNGNLGPNIPFTEEQMQRVRELPGLKNLKSLTPYELATIDTKETPESLDRLSAIALALGINAYKPLYGAIYNNAWSGIINLEALNSASWVLTPPGRLNFTGERLSTFASSVPGSVIKNFEKALEYTEKSRLKGKGPIWSMELPSDLDLTSFLHKKGIKSKIARKLETSILREYDREMADIKSRLFSSKNWGILLRNKIRNRLGKTVAFIGGSAIGYATLLMYKDNKSKHLYYKLGIESLLKESGEDYNSLSQEEQGNKELEYMHKYIEDQGYNAEELYEKVSLGDEEATKTYNELVKNFYRHVTYKGKAIEKEKKNETRKNN